ncbi:MAG: hypothetical protein EPO07_07395 [Verrucomicrobia bacterium]|nr:MAG: hypothetical protein EPO07_07395 [Verrucomicrobiota bacterium]
MKFSGWIIACLLAWAGVAQAQLTAEVVLEQEQYLPAETINAAVKITNRSGQTLKFGDAPDWLTFSIEGREGYVVSKEGEVPVLGEFKVGSSEVGTRKVNLAPYFNLTRPGRYQVIATIHVKEWNQDITTKPRNFEVIHGNTIWMQDFGVPLPAGATNTAPEVRRYSLKQANYLKTQPRLYLSITDGAESKVFKVFPIGPLTSFSNPEGQLDNESNLHVLYQNTGHTFLYTVVSPNGNVLLRQTYDYTKTRPHMIEDEKGRFSVGGGARHSMPDDLPPPSAGDSEKPRTTQP